MSRGYGAYEEALERHNPEFEAQHWHRLRRAKVGTFYGAEYRAYIGAERLLPLRTSFDSFYRCFNYVDGSCGGATGAMRQWARIIFDPE